jgi:hypothetical protein
MSFKLIIVYISKQALLKKNISYKYKKWFIDKVMQKHPRSSECRENSSCSKWWQGWWTSNIQ